MPKCENCGAEMLPDHDFCHECGAKKGSKDNVGFSKVVDVILILIALAGLALALA